MQLLHTLLLRFFKERLPVFTDEEALHTNKTNKKIS